MSESGKVRSKLRDVTVNDQRIGTLLMTSRDLGSKELSSNLRYYVQIVHIFLICSKVDVL